MKYSAFVLSLLIAGTPAPVFAHGENKPGPHRGFIRMPGAYHTELLKVTEKSFRVYLLDMEWKNPTTKDSKISVNAKSQTGQQPMKCSAERDYFKCNLPTNWSWADLSEINIESNREGSHGGIANYRFPLTYAY